MAEPACQVIRLPRTEVGMYFAKLARVHATPGRSMAGLLQEFDFDKIGLDWQKNNIRIINDLIAEDKRAKRAAARAARGARSG